MKNHLFNIFLLILIPFGSRTQPGLEVHYSVNHPLANNRKNMSGIPNESRTFFGAGIGANVLFRDTRTFNVKTGLEVNYFHTWDPSIYSGQMSSRRNVHYQYVVVSFPAFVRLTFGKKFKLFLEAGAYLGGCVGGQVQFTTSSYGPSPNQVSTHEGSESYRTGLSITPAIALGARFPLSERLDLFLKPEFAFTRSRLEHSQMNGYGYGYGGSYDFNYSYRYVRFCVGIHLNAKNN